MEDKKYALDLESSPSYGKPDFIKSKRVDDVRTTIDRVEFTDRFRRHIDRNAEYEYVRPKVNVHFSTENTSFESSFIFDPLDPDYWNTKNENTFSSLVSSSYTEWDNFSNIIGSNVTLYSPYDEATCYVQSPLDKHNYSVVSEIEKSEFYCEGISDYFIDIFVEWLKNSVHGRAKIRDINLRKEHVEVVFELKTGRTFSDTFRIKREEVSQMPLQKINPFSDNKKDKREYDFWDLCRDSVGYIPAESNYEVIVGEPLEVEYNKKWMLENI
jgi:hypothetical protein